MNEYHNDDNNEWHRSSRPISTQRLVMTNWGARDGASQALTMKRQHQHCPAAAAAVVTSPPPSKKAQETRSLMGQKVSFFFLIIFYFYEQMFLFTFDDNTPHSSRPRTTKEKGTNHRAATNGTGRKSRTKGSQTTK
jgi:hypothetical protein